MASSTSNQHFSPGKGRDASLTCATRAVCPAGIMLFAVVTSDGRVASFCEEKTN
jgi:hypothetical protein